MKKLIMIAFVAVATYLFVNQKPAAVQKQVTAAASTPAPVARPIVVVPAPTGGLDKNWSNPSLKQGANAQTDLTEGASWK